MADVQYFEDTFSLSDFTTATDLSVADDEFRTVERLEVDKGEVVIPGQGQARNQTDAVGRIFADIKNGGNSAISGKVRLVALNSQNRVVHTYYQAQISTVSVGASTRSDRRPFPRKRVRLAEPYKLAIQVKTASGTDTYSDSNSTVEFDGFRGEAIN
jgi:hypothetical protein